MKKISLLILGISILFFSCSNSKTVDVNTLEQKTIKQIIVERNEKELWTRALEENLLNQPLIDELFDSSVTVSSETYKAVYSGKSPVYPSIKDFGSVDISSLDKNCQKILNDFCKTICFDYSEAIGDYFNEKYIFNAVFFMKDLCQNWEINFDTKFPVKKEDVKLKLFDTYYIGKPLFTESDSYAEVPLLFISQNKKLYVKILINPDEEKMIYQANIEKWENLHDN